MAPARTIAAIAKPEPGPPPVALRRAQSPPPATTGCMTTLLMRYSKARLVVSTRTPSWCSGSSSRSYLLGTGERVLVEASPMDRVWGIGLATADERAADPARWRGLNLLGFALMETRDRLR